MISVIYPINSGSDHVRHHNRLNLFKNTVDSIIAYSQDIKDQFELLVLDEKSTDDISGYVTSLKSKLDISYIKYISPYPFFTGSYVNNLGVNLSKYDSIVLTSPEVKHITPVLSQFIELQGENILGKVDELDANGNVRVSLMSSTSPTRSNNPGMYFLAMFNKSDFYSIGGIDEDFMENGMGYEDSDFGWRFNKAGIKYRVVDDIYGHHQYHGRHPERSMTEYKINGQLWKTKEKQGKIVVNHDRIMGDTSNIIERL